MVLSCLKVSEKIGYMNQEKTVEQPHSCGLNIVFTMGHWGRSK